MRNSFLVPAVLGANIIAAMQVGKVPAALPLVGDDLGLSLVQTGWVLSLTNLIAAGAAFAVPALSTLVGARRLALLAAACLALGSLAGSASWNAATLFLTRVVEGAGLLLMMISGPTLLAQVLAPHRLRILLALWPMCMPVGIAATLAATPTLVEAAGWRSVWAAAGLAAAAAGAVLAAATRGLPTPHTASGIPNVGRMLRQPARRLALRPLRWCAAISLCYSAEHLGVLGMLPSVLGERAGAEAVTLLTAAAFLANGIGVSAAALLQLRGVAGSLLLLPAAVLMIPCLWVVYAPDAPRPALMAAAWTFAALGGLIASAVMAGAAQWASSPTEVSAGVAAVIQSINLGQLVGPPLVALTAAGAGWAATPAVLMVPAGVVLVGGVVLRRCVGAYGG
ncbi:MFS transporter [Streptomyces cavernicola]|uniref:MFS transporter n=1 Tax=Streptomyces cavernicola TaxID=3043613 RepID=A0ABT6SE89_9ACTN|nr:MFS transporter [Streptomyces sp. B-S-A6]MDI3405611.1 MFS transporter [Streptomyces sp. B-S-A6]